MLYPQNGDRTMAIDFVTSLHPIYSETSHWMKFYTARSLIDARIRNESVLIQLAQCWFPGLAISSAKT